MKTHEQHYSCPLCMKDNNINFISKNEYILYSCLNCGHVYLTNHNDSKDLYILYQENFYKPGSSARFTKLIENFIYLFRIVRAKSLVNLLPEGKHVILDIGCGRGWTLKFLNQKGWKCTGTQISKPAAEYARKTLGLEIHEKELPDIKFDSEKFDIVTVFHVLEHLQNPIDYINDINRILKPNGFLIIEVPNLSSLCYSIFKLHWFAFALPHHISFFKLEVLNKILKKHGFIIKKISHFSLEYSLFTWLQSGFNLLLNDNDHFFNFLERKYTPSIFRLSSYILLSLPLLLFSLILSIFAAIIKRGDVVRLICIKKNYNSLS